MESVVDDYVSDDELKRFENLYTEQQNRDGRASVKATFEYAWVLVRSRAITNVRRGSVLLEELLKTDDDGTVLRDYLFYLAVAHLKLKEFDRALKVINVLLESEPSNQQALDLKLLIERRMRKDGIIGAAILGGSFLAGGALLAAAVTAVVALTKKK